MVMMILKTFTENKKLVTQHDPCISFPFLWYWKSATEEENKI